MIENFQREVVDHEPGQLFAILTKVDLIDYSQNQIICPWKLCNAIFFII